MTSRMTVSRFVSHLELQNCYAPSIPVFDAVASIDRLIVESGGDPKAADTFVRFAEGVKSSSFGDCTQITKEWLVLSSTVLAERERCARIVENEYAANALVDSEAAGVHELMKGLAAKIRGGL